MNMNTYSFRKDFNPLSIIYLLKIVKKTFEALP